VAATRDSTVDVFFVSRLAFWNIRWASNSSGRRKPSELPMACLVRTQCGLDAGIQNELRDGGDFSGCGQDKASG
jgi:hypothetical protein